MWSWLNHSSWFLLGPMTSTTMSCPCSPYQSWIPFCRIKLRSSQVYGNHATIAYYAQVASCVEFRGKTFIWGAYWWDISFNISGYMRIPPMHLRKKLEFLCQCRGCKGLGPVLLGLKLYNSIIAKILEHFWVITPNRSLWVPVILSKDQSFMWLFVVCVYSWRGQRRERQSYFYWN